MVAERSPSSVLLLLHAERNAVPACGQVRPGDCLDELVPVVEVRAPHQSDVSQPDPNVSDASDAVRPDVAEDAVHQIPALPEDAGAGKSAVPVQGAPAQGDRI